MKHGTRKLIMTQDKTSNEVLPNGKLKPFFVQKRKKIRKIWIMETLSKDADFKPLSLLTNNPTVDKYILLKIVCCR
jgi:hypothetical protein